MTELFLERTFDPGLSVDDVCAMAVKNGWCYTMYGVVWRGSFLATNGGRMVCWFKAPDAESARQALRRAGADMTRLWIGTAHE